MTNSFNVNDLGILPESIKYYASAQYSALEDCRLFEKTRQGMIVMGTYT